MKTQERMSRICRVALVLVVATTLGACAARPATTSEAVERLFENRRDFQGARSLANVRITGKGGQSFRAAIAIDADGNMTMSALTPFGTTAAHIRVEGDTVTLINHLRNTFWRGSIDELSGGNPLADALRLEGMPYLLTGLPPWPSVGSVTQEPVTAEIVRMSDQQLTLVVGRNGLLSGELAIGRERVTVRFGEPGIPPAKLEVTSSIDPTRMLQFEHLDLDFEPVTLDRLEIPDDYSQAEYWETVVR